MSKSDVTGENDEAITELESVVVSDDVSSDVPVDDTLGSL